MKWLLSIIAAISLVACGGGTVLNARSDGIQAETDFCGVSITFTSKPRPVPKQQIEEYLDTFGRHIKNSLIGLYSENHQLTEAALCLCKDTSEVSNRSSTTWKTNITPHIDSVNFKNDIIDGIGPTESWNYIDVKSNIANSFKVIDLSSRSSCQLMLQVITPANSQNRYFPFLNSTTEIRSKAISKNTPKDRLIQLDAMRKDGLINQADYDAKKKSILDSL